MINDENNKVYGLPYINPNEQVKLITDIIIEENNRQFISAKKFLSLPDKAAFTIIHMLLNQYTETTNSHKLVASKFQLTLINLLNQSIETFRNSYSDILELQEYFFQAGLYSKNKTSQNIPVLDLVLRSKIVDHKKIIDLRKFFKSLTFSTSFKINRHVNLKNKKTISNINNILIEEIIHSWKVDIRKPGCTSTWFASEAEEFKKLIYRHCYSQPVKSFILGDIIEIKINILSSNGSIIPESINWNDLIVSDIETHNFLDFHKGLRINPTSFDSIRFCELENIVHIWKNEKSLTKRHCLDDFCNIFKENFEISEINYDCLKFYVFKLEMKAVRKGVVKKNKFSNVCIEILDKLDNVSNEIQCLGLLNINGINKKTQIRIGDVVWFYVTDL
jgi:hypothetical protein